MAGNLNYGICRCGLDGKFLEANEAMVGMLGYASREELLAMNLGSDIIQDLARWKQLLGQSAAAATFLSRRTRPIAQRFSHTVRYRTVFRIAKSDSRVSKFRPGDTWARRFKGIWS